jgi:release factor glutamine methyltransferase
VTIDHALERAAARLDASNVPSPEADAELLLRHVLGVSRARLVTEGRSPLASAAEAAYEVLVEERAKRRPLQHLVGTQAFWKHEFLVTPDVLIPRPETELVVEEALRALAGRKHPLVVDVGTGSGCIALSIAAGQGDAEVHAIDISPEALAVARQNAARLGLEDRVRFHEGDLLAPLRQVGDARFAGGIDVVASNPPYVDPADRASLAPEVRDHEPPLALFPPGDPCSIYRRLVLEAFAALRPGGALILEIGVGMGREVAAIVEAAGFAIEKVTPDLQGIPRTVLARRL